MNQQNTNSVSNDTSMWTPASEAWNMDKIDRVISNNNYDNILLSKGRLAVNNNQAQDDRLGTYDILCGRGRASWNNCGNKKFRVLINLNMQRYMEAGTNKQEKSKIIHSISDRIQNDMGGRFFKQQGKNKELIELCRKECHEKIGHALRDLVALQHQSTRSSSTSSSASMVSTSSVSTSSVSSVSSMSSTSSSSWCSSDEEREISHDISFSDSMDLSKLALEPIGDSFFDRSLMTVEAEPFVDPFC